MKYTRAGGLKIHGFCLASDQETDRLASCNSLSSAEQALWPQTLSLTRHNILGHRIALFMKIFSDI